MEEESVELVNPVIPLLSGSQKLFCSTPNYYYLIFQYVQDQVV